jgi:hypothetical protein
MTNLHRGDMGTRDTMAMPENTSLPFFAYGFFAPGQLAFLQLADKYPRVRRDSVHGSLRLRDGLRLLDTRTGGPGVVEGTVLSFPRNDQRPAYRAVCNVEPQDHYEWKLATTTRGTLVNCLEGRVIVGETAVSTDGCPERDPLLGDALDFLAEIQTHVSKTGSYRGNRSLFCLEMVYAFLWSCIDRYLFMRYRLRGDTDPKLRLMAKDPRLCEALARATFVRSSIRRIDDPSRIARLDSASAYEKLSYCYGIRCNLVHHGKDLEDYNLILNAFCRLLPAFRVTVDGAFEDSSRYRVES